MHRAGRTASPLKSGRADGIAQYRVFLTAPHGMRLPEDTPVTFRLVDAQGRAVASQSSNFLGPKP